VCQCTCMEGERQQGYHLITLLGLSLLVWPLNEDMIIIINDLMCPINALELSVWTEKAMRSEEEVYSF
jgi:hypothetical protein